MAFSRGNNMPATAAYPANEKKAQFIWTGFILMFFVLQAILWSVAITFTANDPSHRVVAGYDEQALGWDEQRALQAASDALAWRLTATVDPAGDIYRNRDVSLAVQDASGQPVTGLVVTVEGYHRGRAAEVMKLTWNEVEPGRYVTSVPVHYPGRWQFSGTMARGDDTRIVEEALSIPAQRGP